MFTARNFSKINKNILHLFPNKQIKLNKQTITQQSTQQSKNCFIKNYKSHPDFTIKIVFRQCKVIEYVDDLVMRSSMMI